MSETVSLKSSSDTCNVFASEVRVMRFVRTHMDTWQTRFSAENFRFEGSLTRLSQLKLTQTRHCRILSHRAAPLPVGMHQVEVQDAEVVAARGTLKIQKSTRILCMLLCYAMLCNAMQCYGSAYD